MTAQLLPRPRPWEDPHALLTLALGVLADVKTKLAAHTAKAGIVEGCQKCDFWERELKDAQICVIIRGRQAQCVAPKGVIKGEVIHGPGHSDTPAAHIGRDNRG